MSGSYANVKSAYKAFSEHGPSSNVTSDGSQPPIPCQTGYKVCEFDVHGTTTNKYKCCLRDTAHCQKTYGEQRTRISRFVS